ncbi:transporter [Clostridium sp. SYSU_GA19001]|uniref:putative ABC transporter permease subunit n=1 Tax=Clostridium caldaquaticum TaxID=2940653 RepID=UPI002077254D|nr:transporter [Clostridium caldaquaticum]MCM8709464.1 transporter [Clostridium caldaquaticum]
MNKFLVLTKVLFKTGGESLVQKDKKRLPKTIALLVLMVVAFIPMISVFVAMAAGSYWALAKLNQQGLILEFGILASCLVIFIFGIFFVMSTFYFSSDIESLLPMPLKPSMILGAKFTVVLIYEYFTELVFLLPVMITYGVMSSAGFIYYLYGAIVFFALPVIPLVVASFISMIIMRFAPFTKNKDAFNMIAGIIGLILAIGFNIIFQKFGASTKSQEQMSALMMKGNNSLAGTSSKLFPSAKLAVRAMVYNGEIKGFVNILLFIAVTIALLAILLILGEALYFKGVIGISEASAKRKKLSSKEFEESTVQTSAFKAYTIKEMRLLFRTPAYFMNCVLMNFLFPIFLFIPVISQPEILKDLDKLREVLRNGTFSGIVIAVAFGAMMFISVVNPVAPTAISREGQKLFVCRYLPISYKKQIMAKVLSSVLLNFIGLGLLIIIAAVILVPPVYLIIQLIVLAVLATLFGSFLGILIDLIFPKLQWDTEQRAVKNNFNVIILMFIGFAVAGLTIFAIVIFKLNLWTAFGALVILYGILDIILYIIISTAGVYIFEKIQS